MSQLFYGREEAARRAGVSPDTVSRIERGIINAPARTIKALTDALGQEKASRRGAA
jgi:transcriptional regulator with XRE-family HTH domain